MAEIILNKALWTSLDNIHFSGYLIYNGRYIKSAEAINYIKDLDLEAFDFSKLSGQFAIIGQCPNATYLISDKLRSIPLFFSFYRNRIIISDEAENCYSSHHQNNKNSTSVQAFLRCGYTLDHQTLIKDIFSTEPGEIIKIRNTTWEQKYYFTYPLFKSEDPNLDFAYLNQTLNEKLEFVFRQLFENIKDKPVAVSLSGGYDSRLIAVMATKYHPQSLYFVTYGLKNHPEVILAEKVAKRLGIKWIFIEYNQQLVSGFTNTETFNSYYRYASNLSSMFYLQDYFAIKKIKEEHLIPDDCVFIPGHSGDSLSGRHLTKKIQHLKSINKVTDAIFNYHFNQIKSSKKEKEALIKEIETVIPRYLNSSWQAYDFWYLYQRQPKFILNSCRVYTFFGYNYFLPLWHDELHQFFLELPLRCRLNKNLYNRVLKRIFKEYDLDFKDEIGPNAFQKKLQTIKNHIKKALPPVVINYFTNNISPFFYHYITRILKKETTDKFAFTPTQKNYFNAYIIQWYLQSLFGSEKKHSGTKQS